MGDINQINDVGYANISQINDVATANVNEVNDQGVAASGATRWVAATENGYIAHAANSDLTSWTAYDAYDEGSANQNTGDSESVAYGKNSSGAGIFIATRSIQSGGTQIRELTVSGTDVTSSGEWTNVDLDGSSSLQAIMEVQWGARSDGSTAGTWIAVGKQGTGNIYRSTDGAANWSAVDISGLTGHQSGNVNHDWINGVANDGAGKWMFAQDNRIYYSTDDGASWAVSTPFSSNSPGYAHNVLFTNSSWVLIYSRSSKVRFRSCAASDITDWGNEVDSSNMHHTTSDNRGVKAAAANGNVCAVTENHNVINRFTVSGKTIGTVSAVSISGSSNPRHIATDGTKWVAVCNDGDVLESTDNGANWTERVNGFQADGSSALDFEGVAANGYLPL